MDNVVLRCFVAQLSEGRAYVNLDALGHALGHLDVVLACHIVLYVGCQLVAGNADGVVAHDAAEGDDGNLGGTAADVDNHVALRSLYVDADTYGSSHRLEDEVHVTSVGVLGRVAYGTQLHLRRTGRNAYHHAQGRREEMAAAWHHLYQTAHHHLARREVCYHSVAERAHRLDAVVGLLVHALGTLADSYHLVAVSIYSYNGRLVHYYLVIGDDDSIGSTEVHCNLLYKGKKSHFLSKPKCYLVISICLGLSKSYGTHLLCLLEPCVDGRVVV